MATINIRIDDELKSRSYAALEKLGVTPSEVLRQTLEYVAQSGRLPFQQVLLTEDDADLMAIVRDRLENPQAGASSGMMSVCSSRKNSSRFYNTRGSIKIACESCMTATKSSSVHPVIAWSIRFAIKPLRYSWWRSVSASVLPLTMRPIHAYKLMP